MEFAAPAGSAPRVTDIRQDLARFDSVFGLPAPSLRIVNSLARSPSPWLANTEEVEDTEIVHAVAPDAAIREVLVGDAAAESAANASAGVAAALRLGADRGRGDLFQPQLGRTVLHRGRGGPAERGVASRQEGRRDGRQLFG